MFRRPVIMAAVMILAIGVADELPGADMSSVDHLVFAVPDLENGIELVLQLTGIRAEIGGRHPGLGTRNALIALGPATYLEIIAPDPGQPDFDGKRPFGIDELDGPRLVTWAAKSPDIELIAGIGDTPTSVLAGSRRKPDGTLLTWRFTDPSVMVENGIAPFFIDWGNSPHPAASAPAGATLESLSVEHPDPQRIINLFRRLGIDIPVIAAAEPGLIAVLDTPAGRVELR